MDILTALSTSDITYAHTGTTCIGWECALLENTNVCEVLVL